jgi:two-component system cell cycle sensor histidine kinase/response regulator CckA
MTDPPHRAWPGSWLSRFKIQGKLIFGFGLELALVAGVAAAGLLGLHRVKGSFQSAIDHGLAVERLAGKIQNELLEARRAENNFLLRWPSEGFDAARKKYVTANQERVARIRDVSDQLEAAERAGTMTEGDSRTLEDLVALRPYVNVYAEDFRAAVGLIGQRAAMGARPDHELSVIQAQIDKRIEDFRAAAIVVEPLVTDIALRGQRDAAAQITAAEAASRNSVLTVSLCFITAILTGLGLAYILGHQIRDPLQSLARTAEAVGAGDLTARAEVVADDEIGTLAITFNTMTVRLRGLVASLEERVLERERAEEAWRGSQELLQSIIDNSLAVIYVKDLEGRFLLVNRRLEELLGVPKGGLLGQTDYDLFPKETADAYRAVDQRALLAGTTVEAEEVGPRGEDIRTYISIKCPLRDRNGIPYAVCGISTDITERKRVEEQLRQSQKMEAIGRLAGGIAHDFNNLLTAINGYTLMALQRTNALQPLHDYLGEILKAGERAAGLTRQLLAYSRKQVLEPKVWNLNVIVSEMEPMLRRLIGEDIDLIVRLDPAIGLVKVDRGQVEQIILNLAVNAREAMPRGGSLTMETTNELDPKTPSLEPLVGPRARLSVSDTGTGMTPEVKARVFEPFFTTKDVGKGTGLGLSVVYGIVQQSGGTISVDSEPNVGTTFRIHFPHVIEKEIALEGRTLDPPRSYDGRETVLLVEDEDLVRKFARYALEAQGYTVIEAAHGGEAYKLLEKRHGEIDLVITDVVMPEMGGRALAIWMRGQLPTVPVLFMSGYTEHASVHEGIVEEGEHFLQKPFGPTDLGKKVREVLDGHRRLMSADGPRRG